MREASSLIKYYIPATIALVLSGIAYWTIALVAATAFFAGD